MTMLRLGRHGLGVAMVLAAVGVAYATIPGSDGAIHGCYRPDGGLRLIDSDAGQSCRAGEAAIQWRAAVSLGCPPGTLPFIGVCIETASRTPADLSHARFDCADEGRRLPLPGELYGFRDVEGITLSSAGEWTDDLGDATGGVSYVTVAESGEAVLHPSAVIAYRCVAGPVLR
jgi:hypothetical protein